MVDKLDEAFYSMLIASERVDGWLRVLRTHKQGPPHIRVRQALKELVEALQSESYAEEVRPSCVWQKVAE